MILDFRFAIVGDPHIGLPHTIWDHPSRFHLIEVSIPGLEQIFQHLSHQSLDFLLLPGDLTQHGERDNHQWLSQRLRDLPFPVYVVPGNHDAPNPEATDDRIGPQEFPKYYRHCGYDDTDQLYYSRTILPGVRLIGLNSNQFDDSGTLIGQVDEAQLTWLQQELEANCEELVLVMIHHNIVEHLPNQSRHPLGKRYMLKNAKQLLSLLDQAQVPLIFTGHLHVQNIAPHIAPQISPGPGESQGNIPQSNIPENHIQGNKLYEITTGSLVSYPHPYRICHFHQDAQGQRSLQVESPRITALPQWPTLQETSRQWMGDRSHPFMMRMLTGAPLHLPEDRAAALAPHLRDFWASIADGDVRYDFSDLPPEAQDYFAQFHTTDAAGNPVARDNNVMLFWPKLQTAPTPQR